MIKNQKGFTLTEILISAGLLGFISLMSASLLKKMTSEKNRSETKLDKSLFNSSFTLFLVSQKACSLYSASGGLLIDGTVRPLVLAEYVGYGVNASQGSIGAGFNVTPKIQIPKLNYQIKPGTTPMPFKFQGADRAEQIMQITYSIKTKISNASGSRAAKFRISNHSLDLGVITDDQDKIIGCLGSTTIDAETMCASLGGFTFNSVTEQCEQNNACTDEGSYVSLSSSHGSYGAVWSNPPTRVNPVTNAYSCPTGSTGTLTYFEQQSRNVPTGKKSSVNVISTLNYVSCMTCRSI